MQCMQSEVVKVAGELCGLRVGAWRKQAGRRAAVGAVVSERHGSGVMDAADSCRCTSGGRERCAFHWCVARHGSSASVNQSSMALEGDPEFRLMVNAGHSCAAVTRGDAWDSGVPSMIVTL